VHNGTVEIGNYKVLSFSWSCLVVFLSMHCILCMTFMHDGLHHGCKWNLCPHYLVLKTMGTRLAKTIMAASSTHHQQCRAIPTQQKRMCECVYPR